MASPLSLRKSRSEQIGRALRPCAQQTSYHKDEYFIRLEHVHINHEMGILSQDSEVKTTIAQISSGKSSEAEAILAVAFKEAGTPTIN